MTKKIDVSYVAELARLDLTPEEKRLFQAQLETIVGYVGQIASVAISGTDATMHGQPLGNVMREDEVVPSLDRERVLANAPDRNDGEFRLPKIVEDA